MYLRKEVCVAEWQTQSAPSSGSGKKQWLKTEVMQDKKLAVDNWWLHRQLMTKGNYLENPLI